jgi:hypothetical protein
VLVVIRFSLMIEIVKDGVFSFDLDHLVSYYPK